MFSFPSITKYRVTQQSKYSGEVASPILFVEQHGLGKSPFIGDIFPIPGSSACLLQVMMRSLLQGTVCAVYFDEGPKSDIICSVHYMLQYMSIIAGLEWMDVSKFRHSPAMAASALLISDNGGARFCTVAERTLYLDQFLRQGKIQILL